MGRKYQRSDTPAELFIAKPSDSNLRKALVKLWPALERNIWPIGDGAGLCVSELEIMKLKV